MRRQQVRWVLLAPEHTATGLAAKVPTLPGAMQAAAQAETQVGLRLAAVGEVETVAVSAEAVTITLAPNAVAMKTVLQWRP